MGLAETFSQVIFRCCLHAGSERVKDHSMGSKAAGLEERTTDQQVWLLGVKAAGERQKARDNNLGKAGQCVRRTQARHSRIHSKPHSETFH